MKNNVYHGENAILDYLTPDNSNPTPLVELPVQLNPFYDHGVRIYAKLMSALPLSNVKSLPAYNLLKSSYDRGELEGKNTIIENSSGNTVYSLAVLSRYFGINTTKAVVSNEISEGKLQLLRFFGVEAIVNHEPICPDPRDVSSGIYKAKVWSHKHNWFNPGQYDNFNNPEAHEKWTGPQIMTQLDGKLDVFCCGLGTTGTMFGAGKYLKSSNPEIVNVGVVRSPNNPVPGPRTRNLLEEIAFDWQGVVDSVVEVGTKESYKASLELCRAGLVVGPSSGFSYIGLLKFLEQQKNAGFTRNSNKTVNCVFICCDTPYVYLKEYFEYLEENQFPEVENQELLNTKDLSLNTKAENQDYEEQLEIDAESAFKEIYAQLPSGDLSMHSGVLVIDLRKPEAYEDFCLPGSINMHVDDLASLQSMSHLKIFLICKSGKTSLEASRRLKRLGIWSQSISGGVIEWSRLNLPRTKNESCKI